MIFTCADIQLTEDVIMKNISYQPMILCLCMILNPTLSSASTTIEEKQIRITGDVYIPPCVINNGQSIDFDFGDMQILKIDGRNYAKSLSFPVVCSYSQGAPYIKVVANHLDGAPLNVLATGINGFGISLNFSNSVSSVYPLYVSETTGSGYPITAGFTNSNANASRLTITAVPYKLNNITLNAQSFSVTATITVVYQ